MWGKQPGSTKVPVEISRDKRVGLPKDSVEHKSEQTEDDAGSTADTGHKGHVPDEKKERTGEDEPS